MKRKTNRARPDDIFGIIWPTDERMIPPDDLSAIIWEKD